MPLPVQPTWNRAGGSSSLSAGASARQSSAAPLSQEPLLIKSEVQGFH